MAYVKDAGYGLFLIWLQCPFYWAHEYEEYVAPGGFLKFFNMGPLGSTRSDKPLTKGGTFWINFPLMCFAFLVPQSKREGYHKSVANK